MNTQLQADQLTLFGSLIERNRQSLFASVDVAISRAGLKHHLVLITVDIQDFKDINMLLGFDRGDAVLESVAYRLLEILRPEDVLCRTGDDEFSILLNPVLHKDHAMLAVHKIHSMFERPLAIGDVEQGIGLHIGLSLYPDTADNAEDLIKQSALAMHQAKQQHGECVVYHSGQNLENQQRQLISQQIREALYSGQIKLVYQPIFDASEERIVGVEGLARWVRGNNDIVLPDEFIPVVEQTGLIQRFSQWVLNTALRECVDFDDLFISINISAINLEDREFPDLVKRALSTWGVIPRRLILEVTETTLMQDLVSTRFVLDRLSSLGVMLAIDDFGSGYSSLKYLRQLPVSFLKIDAAFIENLSADSNDKMIADAVCKLGHSFDLKVIGEGVSTNVSMKIATDLGCDLLQGYYLARPLDPVQLQNVLENQSAPSACQPHLPDPINSIEH